MRYGAVLLSGLVVVGCGRERNPPVTQPAIPQGESRLAVPGGNIWYRVTGAGSGLPVVLVHGGPGFSSFYLKPFEELGDDRPVIRYDQLGGGKSDRISDTTMFNVAHFVRELDSLRAALGIARWHVFGSSWGTILGVEYYRAHPDRVASLVLSGAALNIPAYEQSAKRWLATLPDSIQEAVRRAEAAKDYKSAGYQGAMNAFYSRFVFRRPVAADLDSLFATVNEGIYNYMQGPSEFTITGTLKFYDATPFLPRIAVPTLFTTGEFDEVGPDVVKGFADLVPGARYVSFPDAAHITMWDARDENLRVVRGFLRSVDSAVVRR